MKNKRRSQRRPINVDVFLYTTDGWPLGQCKVRDISTTGAQLNSLPEDELPNRLLLSLSRDGRVRRYCDLVWRNDDEIGVQFREDLRI